MLKYKTPITVALFMICAKDDSPLPFPVGDNKFLGFKTLKSGQHFAVQLVKYIAANQLLTELSTHQISEIFYEVCLVIDSMEVSLFQNDSKLILVWFPNLPWDDTTENIKRTFHYV